MPNRQITRITDTMVIKVVSKKNPFTSPVQVEHAKAVLASNGKTVAQAKKKGADTWTVRELARRRAIQLVRH